MASVVFGEGSTAHNQNITEKDPHPQDHTDPYSNSSNHHKESP
jgi:hypothetical protein